MSALGKELWMQSPDRPYNTDHHFEVLTDFWFDWLNWWICWKYRAKNNFGPWPVMLSCQTSVSSIITCSWPVKMFKIFILSNSQLRQKYRLTCSKIRCLAKRENSKSHCSPNMQTILRCILSHDFADHKPPRWTENCLLFFLYGIHRAEEHDHIICILQIYGRKQLKYFIT